MCNLPHLMRFHPGTEVLNNLVLKQKFHRCAWFQLFSWLIQHFLSLIKLTFCAIEEFLTNCQSRRIACGLAVERRKIQIFRFEICIQSLWI